MHLESPGSCATERFCRSLFLLQLRSVEYKAVHQKQQPPVEDQRQELTVAVYEQPSGQRQEWVSAGVTGCASSVTTAACHSVISSF